MLRTTFTFHSMLWLDFREEGISPPVWEEHTEGYKRLKCSISRRLRSPPTGARIKTSGLLFRTTPSSWYKLSRWWLRPPPPPKITQTRSRERLHRVKSFIQWLPRRETVWLTHEHTCEREGWWPEMDGWHLEKARAGISNGLIIVIAADDSGKLGSDGNKRTKFSLDSCLAMTHNLHVYLTQKNKPFRKGKERKKLYKLSGTEWNTFHSCLLNRHRKILFVSFFLFFFLAYYYSCTGIPWWINFVIFLETKAAKTEFCRMAEIVAVLLRFARELSPFVRWWKNKQ